MFEWFRSIISWLEAFIVGVPIYVAAPTMIVIGALDSSLLSLPEINDYLVVTRCHNAPHEAFYFPVFAALGSVVGCTILYSITRKGGKALLHRKFAPENVQRVEQAYQKYGFLALAVPALLPPPMPFKIFVATAGALDYPRRRFMITILLARGLRYYIEGALAVYYGDEVLHFIENYGIYLLGAFLAVAIAFLIRYLVKRRQQKRGPVTEKL